MSVNKILFFGVFMLLCAACTKASDKSDKKDNEIMSSKTFSGLKLRNIGPAFMSGRIADIAIHPENPSIWYVAVGSGGVWKTENAGTTWQSLFDKESVYSIGSIAIDKRNPNRIWVGTGENVGGRHVSFGDGIYRSDDGGKNWQNMGLKESEHLSTIVIHPENSDIVWVAAQGPLWNKGGERGLYKTVDGGKSWDRVLGDTEWVGVTDVVIDPRNPDRLYAATWQRHRTVAAYMGGGPGSGIHASTDGGKTWRQLEQGLPTGNLGKIGLAISPLRPDVLYAAIELNRRKGAVYRSSNRGASWEKKSDTVSGATGPHYYQELYASPHAFDRIYLADVRMQVSDDGGKTFRRMQENNKHSDNHALVFRADKPDYLLVGTDGGIYESFDLAKTWRYINNLPLTQYYKLAVDDAEPFYTIYGGTQDNNTQGGPSRSASSGVASADWFVVLGGDGHQPAVEPGNPNIVYAQWQQGNLNRIDRATGESVYIKPQASQGEPVERFNWDAPILVSPHSPSTLYFASQRLWKSVNRGDTWQALSPDLTNNQQRTQLPIMEQTWGWEAPWDIYAMSDYSTITSIAESPLEAGLLYVGTDDGLIQISEDSGKTWRKVAVNQLPNVPKTAFVNDIKSDLYNPDTVYVALDNHKFGDYKPYLYVSRDRGRSWQSMVGNLPDRHLVWRIVQDHKSENLFFLATEFGLFFTVDSGQHWIELNGDVPTIAFRDLAIQRREDDLVAASFGRGMFILDDISALREVSKQALANPALLFAPRAAHWYIQRYDQGGGSQWSMGASYYQAPNPPFGAEFTYYLKDSLQSPVKRRKEQEKEATDQKKPLQFPSWDLLDAELRSQEPAIYLTVKDAEGRVIRRLKGEAKKGIQRVSWDLRYPSLAAIVEINDEQADDGSGVMVPPGTYSVTLSQVIDGEVTQLSEPQNFIVKQMQKGTLQGADPKTVADFWWQLNEVTRDLSIAQETIKVLALQLKRYQAALDRSFADIGLLDKQLHQLWQAYHALEQQLNGLKSPQEIGEKRLPTIADRLFFVIRGTYRSSYGPTESHKQSLTLAKQQLQAFNLALDKFKAEDIKAMEQSLKQAGAPWTPGALMNP